jgi:tetratricopeptide (TPR) repeat protein
LMATTLINAPASQEQGNGSAGTGTNNRVWIYTPAIDLLVGCGAWSAPLLLLTALLAGGKAAQWSFAFYLLALLFNYPHFMATAYRAYRSYDELTRYRFYTIHVALLLACAGVVAHLWYPGLPWIFTLYICWSPWHYTGQNFGLAMMFARRAELSPTENERRALHLSFIASYLMLLLSFHTGASADPMIISLGIPAVVTLPTRVTLAVFFLGASGWALLSLARRGGWKATLPTATLVSTQFLWFLLPALVELLSGKEVPQTRYSSGILAVLHSAQYLWITSYYQRKEARAAGEAAWSFARYLLILVAGGIALFVPGPWIVSRVFHADFGASFLTFTALVNLHHFTLDGAIWKLRDSRIARFLLNTPESEGSAEAKQQSVFARGMHWLASATAGARALRIGTVVVLLVWGSFDRLHFYYANVAASLPDLQRAAKWTPDDSTLQLRLAHAEAFSGDKDAALRALQHAAEVNLRDWTVQQAYAEALIQAGQYAQAYALYQKVLAIAPKNADALVNYGLLAHQLGHDTEAIDTWQRAVDWDPRQANAQLYLAQALDQVGESAAAARHYRAYLQDVAKEPEKHRGEGAAVISALIKVADGDAAAGQLVHAQQGYATAAEFAQKSGDATLQSLALMHSADVQERLGKPADAAHSYQQALKLDEQTGDAQAAAIDWLNYGQFLQRQKQPQALAFACFLKAEDLLRASPGKELSAIVKQREAAEMNLGKEAAPVRSKLPDYLGKASSLSTFEAAINPA